MKREVDNLTILDKFVVDFVKVVEKHCKYIIVSGFVAISHGRSRGTEDIDMIIEKLSEEGFKKLHNDLMAHGFLCVQSDDPHLLYRKYLSHKEPVSIRYIRKETYLPEMEIKFAKDSLDEYQIQTRKKLPFTHLDVYFSSIESNIAFKEELLKSDKDIKDAKHLREIYSEELDEEEIERIKQKILELR